MDARPTSEEGSIIKRDWWKVWRRDDIPLKHVIQSYDTAFLKKKLQITQQLQRGVFTQMMTQGLT